MVHFIFNAALLSIVLATVSASPIKVKRFLEGNDCTSDSVSDNPPGLFFALDSEGTSVNCDDIDTGTSSSKQVYPSPAYISRLLTSISGYACYRTVSDPDQLGDSIMCPGDPPPEKNPDGSVTDPVADGFIDTWCKSGASLPGAAGEFTNIAGCFMFGYLQAHGDPVEEAESGAKGVCDVIFAGACTWFFDIQGITTPLCDPCDDDPDSVACNFGGPAK
jgi:hypothetical protein